MSKDLKGVMFQDIKETEGSEPGIDVIDAPMPDPVPAGKADPASGKTQYEVVGSVDRNVKNPATEAANTASTPLVAETSWELGSPGAGLGEAADLVLPDALLGSYPELLDQFREEVIIFPDDRIRVQNTTVYPWRAICALRIQAANGQQFIGTGWMISPRTVITAGHCVFLHDAGGWARSIEVIPGMNDASRPYGSHVGTALRSVTGWTQGKNRDFDYGAIILPPANRPGVQTGTFGFAVRDDAFLKNAMLNLSGYPGDKGGAQQWFHAQKAKATSSRVITYDIDTMGGQSGSPVWVLQNGQRYAVGVHTNGAASGNSATRIVSDMFANLVNWKNLGA
ncbi:serine protease [Sphingomonas sp. RB3P16]|uniref:trypsin-like serine peptidase n=1 Tax=Parasphingomonas frigoris TaxID=3096163 RepID=UPI002FCC5C8F